MTFANSQNSRVAVGLLNASGYARDYQVTSTTDTNDTTVLTDRAKTFVLAQDTSTFTINMLLDTSNAVGGQYDTLKTWRSAGTAYPITLAPFGFTTGSFATLLNGLDTALTTGTSLTEAVPASVTGQATGNTDYGTIVEDFTAITIDTTGTARDGLAATANGGVAHLHVSAFSGLTSNAITIEHSVNGSTAWATLVTFSTVTAIGAQRVEIAAGTSVRQYLRVVDDVTGSGSCTRLVAFARR